MDPVDWRDDPIARNRLLLAQAAEVRIEASAAIALAREMVRTTARLRLAWERTRQPFTPPGPPDLP